MKQKENVLNRNIRFSLMLFFSIVLFLCAGTMIANADTGNVVTWDNETFSSKQSFNADTTIVLKGDNKITIPDNVSTSIYAEGALTIKGTGSLTVNGKIDAGGDILMESGKVNITAKYSSSGLLSSTGISITGGELTIDKSYGIAGIGGFVDPGGSSIDVTISGGAKVKVTVDGSDYGIYSDKLTVDNAELTAIAPDAYYGIMCTGMSIKNNSRVKAVGNESGIASVGPDEIDNSYVEMEAAGTVMLSEDYGYEQTAYLGFDYEKEQAAGLTLKNCRVTTPVSGKVATNKVMLGSTRYDVTVIAAADGSTAKKAVIEPVVTVTAAESAIMKALGVDAATAKAINAYAAANGISADTLKITNKLLTTGNTDSDVKGSKFGLLQAYSKKIKKKAITIKWNKVKGADGYMIYSNKCGKKNKCKLVKTLPASKTTFTNTKLKKGTYYKYIVVAYKNFNGTKVTISASPTVHAATLGGKYGVAKKVKIVKVGKKKKAKITLKKGKTAKIKAKEVKGKKKIKKHRKLCYESSNTKVATVTKKGVIKAVAKGKCKIYVYAQNGVKKAVAVTVK